MRRLASYVIFIVCCGLALSQQPERKCLREKVIVFPELSTNTWVKLHPNESMTQTEFTVCLRFYPDPESSNPCLFSIATPSNPRDISLLWFVDTKQYELVIHNSLVQFNGLPLNLNQWNTICVTWDVKNALAQMFVNEVASIKRVVGPKQAFKGEPVISLGQCQTKVHSAFHLSKTFTGFISDVHMHNQVLTINQIKTYMEAKSKYKLGDYINWHNLMYTIFGSAEINEKHHVTFKVKEEQP